jgi:hypothetical protein
MFFYTLVFGAAGVLCVAFVILQFYNGAYKRMGHEAHKTPLLGKTAFVTRFMLLSYHPLQDTTLVYGCRFHEIH